MLHGEGYDGLALVRVLKDIRLGASEQQRDDREQRPEYAAAHRFEYKTTCMTGHEKETIVDVPHLWYSARGTRLFNVVRRVCRRSFVMLQAYCSAGSV